MTKLASVNLGSRARMYAASLNMRIVPTEEDFHNSVGYCLDATNVIPTGSVVATPGFPGCCYVKMLRRDGKYATNN